MEICFIQDTDQAFMFFREEYSIAFDEYFGKLDWEYA